MEKSEHRPIRWSGVLLRFIHLIVLTFFARLIQNWIGSQALSHQDIIQKALGCLYLLIAIWWVIIPLLKDFGIETEGFNKNLEK